MQRTMAPQAEAELELRYLYDFTTYARENAVGDTETPLACLCADRGKARSIPTYAAVGLASGHVFRFKAARVSLC
jgi:hypothetical protein